VTFMEDDMLHRQEVDTLYNAMQQLMAGNIPHFILSHEALTDILQGLQRHLEYLQLHMILSRLDHAYYYSEASFKVFRNNSVLFLVNNARVVFKSLAMPFLLYELVKLPLTTHHQHEFYTTLTTQISTLVFNHNVNYFLQLTDDNRPYGSVCQVTDSAVLFVDCAKPTCGRGLMHGNLTEVKA